MKNLGSSLLLSTGKGDGSLTLNKWLFLRTTFMKVYFSLRSFWDLLEFLELEDLSLTLRALSLGLSFMSSLMRDFYASCLMGEIIIELSSSLGLSLRSRDENMCLPISNALLVNPGRFEISFFRWDTSPKYSTFLPSSVYSRDYSPLAFLRAFSTWFFGSFWCLDVLLEARFACIRFFLSP